MASKYITAAATDWSASVLLAMSAWRELA